MDLLRSFILTCFCLVLTSSAPSRHHKHSARHQASGRHASTSASRHPNGRHSRSQRTLSLDLNEDNNNNNNVIDSRINEKHNNNNNNSFRNNNKNNSSKNNHNSNNVLSKAARKIRQLKKRERKGKFSFQDCGVGSDRPIQFLHLGMNPRPLTAPGKVKLQMSVNVTETLPEALTMSLSIKKSFFGIKWPLPCLGQFGSCTYEDVCYELSRYSAEYGCPFFLEEYGLPCNCASLRQRKLHKVNNMEFFIPSIESMQIPSYIAEGEYEVESRITDDLSGRELGCLRINFHLRQKPCKGKWYCDLTW